MSQVVETRKEEEVTAEMMDICNDLFREWSVDLNLEEKKIWLWNASVAMHRIKQRRPLAC